MLAIATEPDRPASIAKDLLRTSFGLTAAEADVAALLAEAHSALEIADLRGVTRETIKSQIKILMSKMGTSRQSEVVRLLGSFAGT